jgi:tryptophan synthase alpha chain
MPPSISEIFESQKQKGRGTLIGFLTCGDPSPKDTPVLAKALVNGGVDILELGIPFSDPIADGPTIQAADVRALKAGTTTETALEIASRIRQENKDIPLVFLTYFNPILRFGIKRFISRAMRSGVNGIVVPDLPIDDGEAEEYRSIALEKNICTILLATPTTTKERLDLICDKTRGFLYLVSVLGVTGARKRIDEEGLELIKRVCNVKEHVPVAVGFGISKPVHIRSVLRAGADGAIVGSAFVNIVAENLHHINKGCKELEVFARRLKEATFSSNGYNNTPSILLS